MRLPIPSLFFFLLPAHVRSQLLTSPSPQPPTPALPTPPQQPPLPSPWIAITSFLSATPPFLSPTPTTLPSPPNPDDASPLSLNQELKRRQAAGVGAAAGVVSSPGATQLPAVTSWAEWTSYTDSGTWTQLHFVYTQLFSKVPDQLPSAASGDVGMGSLTGVVGAVRTDEVGSAGVRARGGGWALGGLGGMGVVGVAGLVGGVMWG